MSQPSPGPSSKLSVLPASHEHFMPLNAHITGYGDVTRNFLWTLGARLNCERWPWIAEKVWMLDCSFVS